MGKALGIDFGTKRTGIAITDAMQIIAGGLTTVLTHLLDDFIADLVQKESIECFVVGDPKNLDGSNTDSTGHVNSFVNAYRKNTLQFQYIKLMNALLLRLLNKVFWQVELRRKEDKIKHWLMK